MVGRLLGKGCIAREFILPTDQNLSLTGPGSTWCFEEEEEIYQLASHRPRPTGPAWVVFPTRRSPTVSPPRRRLESTWRQQAWSIQAFSEDDGFVSLEALVPLNQDVVPYVLDYPVGDPTDGSGECMALVVMKRAGGALVAVPDGFLPPEELVEGNSAQGGLIGPSTTLELTAVLWEDAMEVPVGIQTKVCFVDMDSELLTLLRNPEEQEDIAVVFVEESPLAIPSPAELTAKTFAWLQEKGEQMEGNYTPEVTAESGEGVALPLPKARPKPNKGRRLGYWFRRERKAKEGDNAGSDRNPCGFSCAQGRARLQAELAQQKGSFFQSVVLQMARRMSPTSSPDLPYPQLLGVWTLHRAGAHSTSAHDDAGLRDGREQRSSSGCVGSADSHGRAGLLRPWQVRLGTAAGVARGSASGDLYKSPVVSAVGSKELCTTSRSIMGHGGPGVPQGARRYLGEACRDSGRRFR